VNPRLPFILSWRALILLVALSTLLLLLAPRLALSAEAVVATEQISRGGVVIWLAIVNSVPFGIALAVGAVVLRKVLPTWLVSRRLANDAEVRAYLLPLLDTLVQAIFGRLGLQTVASALSPIGPPPAAAAAALEREVLQAVSYVYDKIPGGTAHFQLDAEDLRQMLKLRLEALAGSSAVSADRPAVN